MDESGTKLKGGCKREPSDVELKGGCKREPSDVELKGGGWKGITE